MSENVEYGRVYETVKIPHGIDAAEVDQIRDYLREAPGVWRTAADIARACGIRRSQTEVRVRKAVTILIERDMLPIVTHNAGFTWASSASMVRVYAENLENRRKGLDRRIEAVRQIYESMQGQTRL